MIIRKLRFAATFALTSVVALLLLLSGMTARRVAANRALVAALRSTDIDGAIAAMNSGADPNIDSSNTSELSFLKVLCRMAHIGRPATSLDKLPPIIQALSDGSVTSEHNFRATHSDEKLVRLVAALIANGADVNVKNRYGKTALLLACRHEFDRCAVSLIAANASMDVFDIDGHCPLYWANATTSRLLLSRGAHVDNVPSVTAHDTSLLRAARNGDTGKTIVLLEHGADPNVQNEYGATSFDMAVSRMPLSVLRKFIKCGAQRKWPDAKFISAAVVNPDPLVIEYFFNSVAKDNLSSDIQAALFYASSQSNLNAVKLLLKHGANVNAHDRELLFPPLPTGYPTGNSALHYASERGSLDIVKLLIDHGSTINSMNDSRQTPLMLAAYSNRLAAASLLVKLGARYDSKDTHGRSASEYVSRNKLASDGIKRGRGHKAM